LPKKLSFFTAQILHGKIRSNPRLLDKPGHSRLLNASDSLLAFAGVYMVEIENQLRSLQPDLKILLEEDNLINLEVATALLRNVGLSVDCAEDGEQAVEKNRNNAYGLILIDIQMPKMDGLEATRLIRSQCKSSGKNIEIPTLAITANVYEEDRRACTEAGMKDFVAKPVDPHKLYSRILKWL
jgi:CheY-like chemotaxis protein